MEESFVKTCFTRKELQEYLGVCSWVFLQWQKEGGGPPAFKIGKRFLYRKTDVEAWIEKQRIADPQIAEVSR